MLKKRAINKSVYKDTSKSRKHAKVTNGSLTHVHGENPTPGGVPQQAPILC